jgi:guanylate kinase
MVHRLKARKTETAQDLQLRIETARQELKRMHVFDYYVVNADSQLDDAVDMIEAIIEAEHHRIHPRRVTL